MTRRNAGWGSCPACPGCIATTDQLKALLANCYSLALFLTLVEEIKFRTVLEDELDILTSLCSELVTFHHILIPIPLDLYGVEGVSEGQVGGQVGSRHGHGGDQ